jgi:nitrite reductase/ring-hydroxylating ferredoxin subunit
MNWFATFLSGWRRLLPLASLPPDTVQVRRVRGLLVGAVSADGRIYVFDARCPHAGQSLQGEKVFCPGVVVCPRHGRKLALSLVPCSLNAMPVIPLPFRIRDGIVEVKVGHPAG